MRGIAWALREKSNGTSPRRGWEGVAAGDVPRGAGLSSSAALELATARWVEWYNQRRLHSSIGDVPPAEFESNYYRERTTSAVA